MSVQVIRTSIVVLADQHNPSVLHPAFLTSPKIVPRDWKLASDPIATPALSRVEYENGMVFVAEPIKFQVIDHNPGDAGANSSLPSLASRYLSALPHVRYIGLGINLHGFLQVDEPDVDVIKRFLRSGPWNKGRLRPKSVDFTFVYPVSGADLRLACKPGVMRPADDAETTGYVVDGNYHTDLSDVRAVLRKARDRIFKFGTRWTHFHTTVDTIFCETA
jgi:hypothetical protein